MAPKPCRVEGCAKIISHGTVCSMHRARMKRHGDFHTKYQGGGKPRPIQETLDMYVPHRPEKGCWEWTGYKDLRGYGRVSWHNRPRFAHRVIFQELRSEELTPDQFLCHHCDNPSCVNPDHLFVGTSADNLRDMRLKGRSARGEKHRAAKLTERDVIEARWRYRNTRVTGSQLVAEYGITPTPMSQMLRGVTWTYLPVYPTSPDWNGGAEYGRTA